MILLCESCQLRLDIPDESGVSRVACPKCDSVMTRPSLVQMGRAKGTTREATLSLVEGKGEAFTIILGDKCSLGRDADNTCQILDGLVSRRHAVLARRGADYVFRDLGSTNGSYVNHEKIVGEIALRDGDRIQIGDAVLVFGCADKTPRTQPGARSATGTMTVIEIPDESIYIQAELDAHEAEPRPEISTEEDLQTVKRAYKKLQLAFALHSSLNDIEDLDDILRKVLEMVFDIFPADRGVILLSDVEGELVPEFFKVRKQRDVTSEIRISRTLMTYVKQRGKSILIQDAQATLGTASILLENVTSAMSVPLFRSEKLVGVLHVDATRGLGDTFSAEDLDILTGIGNQIAIAIDNAHLKEEVRRETELRKSLGRYLSHNLVEQIASQGIQIEMGGETRKVTVLFSDIRGFTSLSETMEPADIVALLNGYFEIMVEVIFRHGGTLDKFIGDAIMAVWGSPIPDPLGASHAVAAAMEMQIELAHFNLARSHKGLQPLHMGIGINTGPALSGNIGSTRRMEYTVIGDTVNLASRIEHLTGPGDIIVSEFTLQDAQMVLRADALGETRVKGKKKAIQPFKLRGMYDPASPQSERRKYPRMHVCLPAFLEDGSQRLEGVVDEVSRANLTFQVPYAIDPPLEPESKVDVELRLRPGEDPIRATGRVHDVRYIVKTQGERHHRLVISVRSIEGSTQEAIRSFMELP